MVKTVELVMIVKNASSVIQLTLQQIKPFINHYTILDTGSTDNTLDIIKHTLTKDLPGNIYQEQFVDFSTSRNRALELASKSCDYYMFLDDSFTIKMGDQLQNLLDLDYDVYHIPIETDGELYCSNRIFKTNLNLKYKHKIHEILKYKSEDVKEYTIDSNLLYFLDVKNETARYRTKQRLSSDIELLTEEIVSFPQNRSYYYRGLTYLSLGMTIKAIQDLEHVYNLNKNKKEKDHFIYLSVTHLVDIYTRENELWSKIEPLYIYLIFLNGEQAEPFYYIALYHFHQKSYKLAYRFSQKAYLMQLPINLISTRKTLYTRDIPILHAQILIQLDRKEKAFNILEKLALNFPDNNEIQQLYHQNDTFDTSKIIKKSSQQILVIHTGKLPFIWNPNGGMYLTTSGSERMAVNLALEFQKNSWGVFVFGTFKDSKNDFECIENGITFYDVDKYTTFIQTHYIDVLLVSRWSSNLYYYPNIEKVYFWIHDVLPQDEIFNTHSTKFKGVICLSNWHKQFFRSSYRFPEELTTVLPNAIYPSRFNINMLKSTPKQPFRFIYTSSFDRGLDNLLFLFPKITEKYPSAELHIFIDQSKVTLTLPKNVFVSDRVNQQQLSIEIMKSDVWLYPTGFEETYCITALEMQAGKVLCATTDMGALVEVVGNRGVLVNGSGNDPEVQSMLLEKLFYVLDRPKIKEYLIENAYKWAIQQSFESLGNRFLQLFSN